MPKSFDNSAHIGARRRQLLRRRRHHKIIAGSVAGVLGALGVGLVMTDTLRFGAPGRPVFAGAQDKPTSTSKVAGTTAATPVSACKKRVLTATTPLKLWIGGDSLAGSLGPSLGTQTAATGVVQPQFNSRVSSGLNSPSFYDWPKHAAEDVNAFQPEVTVFIIGANDTSIVQQQSGDNEPAWRKQYAQLVDQMMTILKGDGRTVYWVGAPIMKDSKRDAGVKELNDVFREEAAKHKGVSYVDTYNLFAGPNGKFALSLKTASGKTVTMRAGDGVHLTPEGGDLMAEAVFKPLDAAWCISKQAVPGATQPVTESPGSSQVPGTHRKVATQPARRKTTTATAARPRTTSAATSAPVVEPPATTPATNPPASTTPPATQPPGP
ncbi:MAG TPA: DUF459 domain-containing protein [Acidimicrobiia bacterium]